MVDSIQAAYQKNYHKGMALINTLPDLVTVTTLLQILQEMCYITLSLLKVIYYSNTLLL